MLDIRDHITNASIEWNKIGKVKARLGTSDTWTDHCPECVAKIQRVIDQRSGINDKGVKDE